MQTSECRTLGSGGLGFGIVADLDRGDSSHLLIAPCGTLETSARSHALIPSNEGRPLERISIRLNRKRALELCSWSHFLRKTTQVGCRKESELTLAGSRPAQRWPGCSTAVPSCPPITIACGPADNDIDAKREQTRQLSLAAERFRCPEYRHHGPSIATKINVFACVQPRAAFPQQRSTM